MPARHHHRRRRNLLPQLSRYPSGLYHLVITTSQGITTKQIIKK
ncbi:MAG: T9SS type A sorting domain-containing protein [Bacteroidales bacterium]|nr:T9SS type A sorting domain-containing protein [Bacteroidales bacterium]